MKKILKVLSIVLLITIICGCSQIAKVNTKEYSVDELKITMADGMVEKSAVGYTKYLEAKDYSFALVKETFEDYKNANLEINENSSVKEYMEFVLDANGINSDLIENNNLIYTKYTKTISSNDYFYMVFGYKSDDSFWIVNLYCFEKDKDNYENTFIEWAKSVHFE
jgi:hypothetical protein